MKIVSWALNKSNKTIPLAPSLKGALSPPSPRHICGCDSEKRMCRNTRQCAFVVFGVDATGTQAALGSDGPAAAPQPAKHAALHSRTHHASLYTYNVASPMTTTMRPPGGTWWAFEKGLKVRARRHTWTHTQTHTLTDMAGVFVRLVMTFVSPSGPRGRWVLAYGSGLSLVLYQTQE